MEPKITLALFNYCQAKYLPDSLGGLISQTDPPDEILIFDDASTDNSVDLLKNIPGAKFYFNEKNLGIFANIEKALEVAENDFIILTAADDILHPSFIAEKRKLLRKSPHLGLICSDCVFFDDEISPRYEIYKLLPFTTPQIFSPTESVKFLRKTGFTILSFTTLYNRHLFRKFGGYNKDLFSLSDFYLNTQIALRYPIGYIPFPSAAARIVANSYGQACRRDWAKRRKIFQRLFELVYGTEPAEFRKLFHQAKLMSFGGLYTLYYIATSPKYWFCLPSLIAKNWKLNFYKIYCLIFKKKMPKLPVKPEIGSWP